MSDESHSIQLISDRIRAGLDSVVNQMEPGSVHNGLLVGYSGGADSTALLHAAFVFAQQQSLPIRAVHINHQIHAAAIDWQQHCEQSCSRLGVALQCHSVDINENADGSLETRCRQARYRVFESSLQDGELLLLAHHQDDVAETLLMNLFRGAGVRGLGAIPQHRALGSGHLLRPLLACTHADLVEYCAHHHLPWIEDPGNRETTIRRNFVRHALMPGIREHWPQATANMQRCATLMREHDETSRILLAEKLTSICNSSDDSLDVDLLRQLEPALQVPVMRQWLDDRGIPQPWYSHWQELMRQLETARPDNRIEIRWPGGCLRVYRSRLYIVDTQKVDNSNIRGEAALTWQGAELPLPDECGSLVWDAMHDNGNEETNYPQLTVSFDYRDRKILLHGHHQRARVRNLFQQAGVPPWQRKLFPGVFRHNRLIAIGDVWKSGELVELENRLGISLRWLRP